jgi:hypothetical protein
MRAKKIKSNNIDNARVKSGKPMLGMVASGIV